MRILILNGPNLNLLGIRQPKIYGTTTLPEIEHMCVEFSQSHGIDLVFEQSNHEGVLIDLIHDARRTQDGIIINAGAYTHTSIALHDALLSVELPVIELHLSDIKAREPFRQHSYIEPVAFKAIMGHGPKGYIMALEEMKARLGA